MNPCCQKARAEARRDALEEAAKECDRVAAKRDPISRSGPMACAAAIRRLAETPKEAPAKDDCKVYKDACAEHGFVHGAEAEELRDGIENVIEWLRDEEKCGLIVKDLQRLLDKVDARDSLAYLEARRARPAPKEEE